MNVREGMRRLGILLGVLGCVIGASFGYTSAKDLWKVRTTAQRFESLVSSPIVQKGRKELMDAIQKDWSVRNAPPEERKKMVSMESKGRFIEGVERFTIDPSTGTIISIELPTGETFAKTPQVSAYCVPLLYPILGFLAPWGAIRLVTWVGGGFFEPPR